MQMDGLYSGPRELSFTIGYGRTKIQEKEVEEVV
jgi:hypothetical protein